MFSTHIPRTSQSPCGTHVQAAIQVVRKILATTDYQLLSVPFRCNTIPHCVHMLFRNKQSQLGSRGFFHVTYHVETAHFVDKNPSFVKEVGGSHVHPIHFIHLP